MNKQAVIESDRERSLRAEAARYRRRVAALRPYRDAALRRMVEPVMAWEVFERLIGVENVVDDLQRIDVDKLVVRINAEHNRVPNMVPKRVSREDFPHGG